MQKACFNSAWIWNCKGHLGPFPFLLGIIFQFSSNIVYIFQMFKMDQKQLMAWHVTIVSVHRFSGTLHCMLIVSEDHSELLHNMG